MTQKRANFQPQLRRRVFHVGNAEELHVRSITLLALLNQWKEYHRDKKLQRSDSYFIECSETGNVNWQNARVFTSSELVGRNNVKVVSFKQ